MSVLIRAELKHLEDLIPLFDAYRVFYMQDSNRQEAKGFLTERIQNEESIIFMAYIESKAIGFTQLYPTFSSVSLQPMLVLNDLFVDDTFRGRGIAKKLLDKAKEYAITQGQKGLALQTAIDNPAQKLYEREGWVRDDAYYYYFWENK